MEKKVTRVGSSPRHSKLFPRHFSIFLLDPSSRHFLCPSNLDPHPAQLLPQEGERKGQFESLSFLTDQLQDLIKYPTALFVIQDAHVGRIKAIALESPEVYLRFQLTF